jgi:hypothetical protein
MLDSLRLGERMSTSPRPSNRTFARLRQQCGHLGSTPADVGVLAVRTACSAAIDQASALVTIQSCRGASTSSAFGDCFIPALNLLARASQGTVAASEMLLVRTARGACRAFLAQGVSQEMQVAVSSSLLANDLQNGGPASSELTRLNAALQALAREQAADTPHDAARVQACRPAA